jgi:hypothetical protein
VQLLAASGQGGGFAALPGASAAAYDARGAGDSTGGDSPDPFLGADRAARQHQLPAGTAGHTFTLHAASLNQTLPAGPGGLPYSVYAGLAALGAVGESRSCPDSEQGGDNGGTAIGRGLAAEPLHPLQLRGTSQFLDSQPSGQPLQLANGANSGDDI